jgi:hypothetical protein
VEHQKKYWFPAGLALGESAQHNGAQNRNRQCRVLGGLLKKAVYTSYTLTSKPLPASFF